MSLSLRLATAADYEEVSRILTNAYTSLMKNTYEPTVLAAVVQSIGRANPALLASDSYFIAEWSGNTSIGCGGWSRQKPGTNEITTGLAHLRHFATHGDWAGRGVGGEIYRQCEEQAVASGIRTFECYSSLNAEGFYRSLGFELLESINVRLGKNIDFPCVRMCKEIA